MIIYPAIDIIDGKAVRLSQGKFDDVTVFNDIPADAAKDWVDAGAEYIHLRSTSFWLTARSRHRLN